MKTSGYLLIIIFCLSLSLAAQKRDTLKLSCPLNEAVEPPPEKQPYSLGVEELKIVLASPSDTTVKACISGTVTNVMRDDDGTWMVMFNHKDYYFLYSGISKTSVRKGQRVQNGDAIGMLKPGEKIEFQLYDFETPLDPKKYLSCFKSQ
jgi:Peptidase family M23